MEVGWGGGHFCSAFGEGGFRVPQRNQICRPPPHLPLSPRARNVRYNVQIATVKRKLSPRFPFVWRIFFLGSKQLYSVDSVFKYFVYLRVLMCPFFATSPWHWCCRPCPPPLRRRTRRRRRGAVFKMCIISRPGSPGGNTPTIRWKAKEKRNLFWLYFCTSFFPESFRKVGQVFSYFFFFVPLFSPSWSLIDQCYGLPSSLFRIPDKFFP